MTNEKWLNIQDSKLILCNRVTKYPIPEYNKVMGKPCEYDKVFPKTSYCLATVYLHTLIEYLSGILILNYNLICQNNINKSRKRYTVSSFSLIQN